MIDFKHNNGDLWRAVFGGTIDDLCAVLCLEMSIIYGAMKRKDERLAEAFKHNMLLMCINRELQDAVFNTEIYDAISGNDSCESGSIMIDNEELAKLLKELLNG